MRSVTITEDLFLQDLEENPVLPDFTYSGILDRTRLKPLYYSLIGLLFSSLVRVQLFVNRLKKLLTDFDSYAILYSDRKQSKRVKRILELSKKTRPNRNI